MGDEPDTLLKRPAGFFPVNNEAGAGDGGVGIDLHEPPQIESYKGRVCFQTLVVRSCYSHRQI